MEILKKNIGGLPVGIWLLIIAAGVGAGLVIRSRANANDGTADDSTDPYADSTNADDSVGYADLPQESYSPFPAGGPPDVWGATQGVRITPDVIRIRVIQPKRHKKPKPKPKPRKRSANAIGSFGANQLQQRR